MKKCKICNSNDLVLIYKGKIRNGRFGNYINKQNIYKCQNCKTQSYNGTLINYETSEYREMIQNNPGEDEYYKQHDNEQLYNIEVLGLNNLRNKTIADVGCGAGSFLDMLVGITKKQIAIEPFKNYQKVLKKKGYSIYDYASNVQAEIGKIDIATSFAVIEHLDDPLTFLLDIKKLIKKGGYILISTPNVDDFQLELIGDDYKSFYYRSVHKWYFNKESISYISKKLGFKKVEFIYKHKYDFSNLLFWLKDKKPTGIAKTSALHQLSTQLVNIVEDNGSANFIYAKLYI